jgi:hypothetical protein
VTVDDLRDMGSPAQLDSDQVRAMWHDLHGDWGTAHRIVQSMYDAHAEWIHAYLHRKEPDIANAKYWYRRCGRPYPGSMGFDDEASIILAELP